MINNFNKFKKILKLSILLSGNESRLLTAQDSAVAKPLLLAKVMTMRFPNTFRLKNERLTKQYVLRRTVYNGKVILDKTNFKYT